MIELIDSRLCSVDEWGTYLDFKCPCLIPLNNQQYCALDYFGDRGIQTAWFSTELENIARGELPGSDWSRAILRPAECIRNQTSDPAIELSTNEKETLIHVLHLKWVAYLRFHPQASWLDSAMVEYPKDPPGMWPVVLIPICKVINNKITEAYATARCFTPEIDDNGDLPVFAYKGGLEFLQSHHIESMVGTIDRWNYNLDEQVGLPLCSLAIEADASIGEAFARFICRYGGCIRMETRNGWCLFQSE